MNALEKSPKIKKILDNFVKVLSDIYQQDLISVALYGSAASGEFVDSHSNINVLVVVKDAELKKLKRVSRFINRFSLVSPLFLREEEIANSGDVFPIEFLDMQENYLILHGSDLLKGMNIDIRNLRFQCEQELKSRLIKLRQEYLSINNNTSALRSLLFKSFISMLHILRNVLRLKGKKPPYDKKEILKELSSEFQIDTGIWEKILLARKGQVRLRGKEVEELFESFIGKLEKIAGIVDKL